MERVKSYEEAVTLIGVGRFHWTLIFVIAASLLAAIGEGLNMAFVLPIAKCDLDISTPKQGLINAVGFIGVMLTSHFWGFMADTWGRQKVLQTALGAAFVSCVLSSMSYTSTMLLVTRLCVGLSICGVQASGISYLGEFHCNANRAFHVNFALIGMVCSIKYQSLLGLVILPMTWRVPFLGLEYTPWRLFLLINSSIIAIAFVMMLTLPESPKFKLVIGQPEEALRILRMVYAKNTGKPEDTYPVDSIQLDSSGSNLANVNGIKAILQLLWKQTWPLFYPPYLKSIMMVFYISFASFFVAHGVYLWMPQILDIYVPHSNKSINICDAMHTVYAPVQTSTIQSSIARQSDISTLCTPSAPNPLIYITTTVFGVGFLIQFLSASFIMKYYGKLWLMFAWFLIIAAASIAMQWTAEFHLNMFLFLMLNSGAPLATLISAVAADFYPTQYKGMALCLIFLMSRLGSIAGSNAVGAMLFDYCQVWLGVDALLMISAAFVWYFLVRSPKSATESINKDLPVKMEKF